MSDTATPVATPETQTGSGDGDSERFAHIVKKEDQMRGYMGEVVEALCGKRWVPSRDWNGYPVCPACKEALGRVNAAGDN